MPEENEVSISFVIGVTLAISGFLAIPIAIDLWLYYFQFTNAFGDNSLAPFWGFRLPAIVFVDAIWAIIIGVFLAEMFED